MIELTKEEAMALLRDLSKLEGFLFSVKEKEKAIDTILDNQCELLAAKLNDS